MYYNNNMEQPLLCEFAAAQNYGVTKRQVNLSFKFFSADHSRAMRKYDVNNVLFMSLTSFLCIF